MAGKSSFKLGKHRASIISNLMAAIVANAASLDEKPDEQAVLADVEAFLARVPLVYRIGILLLFSGLEFMPLIVGYWHRFSRLSRKEQVSFLNWLQNNRFYVCRAVGLAVKSTLILNYLAQPEVEKALGYTGACLIEHAGRGGE